MPIHCKRIKISYKNVKWLCKNCYGPHNKKDCDSEKVTWHEFVDGFAEENPDMPAEFYGSYWEKHFAQNKKESASRPHQLKPTASNFGVPTSKAEFNEFLLELVKTGRSYEDAVVDLKDRIKEYRKACSEQNRIN